MRPIDPNHRVNARDDGETDFAELLAKGLVRTKLNTVIAIDQPKNKWSALDRDRLYQGYCELALSGASEDSLRTWLEARCRELDMSLWRARDLINEGNGQFPGQNMQWWRGVSVSCREATAQSSCGTPQNP